MLWWLVFATEISSSMKQRFLTIMNAGQIGICASYTGCLGCSKCLRHLDAVFNWASKARLSLTSLN